MGAQCDGMVAATKSVWHWFFPKRLDVPGCVMDLLKKIYPTVKWERVTFYEGLPHVFGLPTVVHAHFPGLGLPQGAITLPDSHSFTGINVYLQPTAKDWCNCGQNLNTYVHESMHVLQIQEWLDGWGIGIARPFLTDYLLATVFEGYGNDPFEKQAVAVENIFIHCCGTSPVCVCNSGTPNDPNAATDMIALGALGACPGLIHTSSGLKFWDIFYKHAKVGADGLVGFFCGPWKNARERVAKINGGAPGVTVPDGMRPPEAEPKQTTTDLRWLVCWIGHALAIALYVVWTVVSFVLTLAAAILDWIVEIIGVIATAVMWIVTGIVCAWEWFKNKMNDLHDWAQKTRAGCVEWAAARHCSDWADHGFNVCTKSRDDSRKQCTQTRDDGFSSCCDWAPCSWFCDALVWIANVVCVAWTLTKSVICLVETWVEKWVCMAWTGLIEGGCWILTGIVLGLTSWAHRS